MTAWVFDRAWTEGAEETFEKAGLVVMSSMEIPQGKEYEKPPEPQPEMMREVVIKEMPVEKMVTAAPMAVAAPAAAPAAPQETEGPGGGAARAPVLPGDLAVGQRDDG